jgi:ABC-type amino acid transport substrate-binding protein
MSQNGIDYQALLASALGISVDDLQAAYAKAYNTRIDQAVTDGSLTQEQADLMKGRYALFNSQSYQSAMQTAYEAAVAQAVTDGVITQAQADLILKDNPGAGFPGGRGFGDLDGRHGGMHGGRGGGMPGSQVPATPSTSPSSGG